MSGPDVERPGVETRAAEPPRGCDAQEESSPKIDPPEAERHARALGVGAGEVHELRVIATAGVRVGFFDDPAALAAAAAAYDRDHVYVGVNPLRPEVLQQAANHMARAVRRNGAPPPQGQAWTADDSDVLQQRRLFLDIDPAKPAGHQDHCATDAEHAAALATRDAVSAYVAGAAGAQGTVFDSGNGGALVYDLKEPASQPRIKRVTEALADKFDTASAHLDRAVHNPSRVMRVGGSLNVKQTVPDRPQRRCRLEQAAGAPLDLARLEAALDLPPWSEHGADRQTPSMTLPAVEFQRVVAAWTQTTRHDLCGPWAGMLRKAGWSQAAVEQHVREVCAAAGDAEVADRLRYVHDTFQKHKDAVAGWSALKAFGLEPSDFPSLLPPQAGVFEATAAGILWNKRTKEGTAQVQLTNFNARIVEQVEEDDGVERLMVFEIEATLADGSKRTCSVPARDYELMRWVVEKLGADAIVGSGRDTAGRAREAIQRLSVDNMARRTVYAHLGWREVAGQWVYLHAGGAIGATGLQADVEVRVAEALRRFRLPPPPSGAPLQAAVRASLATLQVAPFRITVPLFAAVWRAVLAQADFSIHIVGATGVFKSELASLAQRHFGAGMDGRSLPASWSSTANAAEVLAFHAKDSLLVVDDFAPGTESDARRLHRDAERLLRAQGNSSARQRLRPDATLRPAKPPRGLIVSTGEDVPQGESLQARLLVLEVSKGDVDIARLTAAQAAAGGELYAAALAAFVRWLAPKYQDTRAGLQARIAALRTQVLQSAAHARTPEIVANLLVGFQTFIAFAREVGAVTGDEADQFLNLADGELRRVGTAQAARQASNEPARRFLKLVASAIASGQAHVAGLGGNPPENPAWKYETATAAQRSWGWRVAGDFTTPPIPQGRCVGWLDGDDLYLDPAASYAVAQQLGQQTNEPLVVTPRTLHKRLDENGLLASTDPAHGSLTVRKTIFRGQPRLAVLHVRAASLPGDTP